MGWLESWQNLESFRLLKKGIFFNSFNFNVNKMARQAHISILFKAERIKKNPFSDQSEILYVLPAFQRFHDSQFIPNTVPSDSAFNTG